MSSMVPGEGDVRYVAQWRGRVDGAWYDLDYRPTLAEATMVLDRWRALGRPYESRIVRRVTTVIDIPVENYAAPEVPHE